MFDIEFNPKESFLKEQLETSGLEMKVFDKIYNAAFSGKINEERRKSERAQQVKLNEQARDVRKYEIEVFKAGRDDYFAQREFEFETALKQYDYNVEIQDYSYGQALARYEKDLGITEAKLGYNEDAFGLSIGDQQAALQDFGLQQAFQRESLYADLQNELINQGFNRETQQVRLETIKTGFENTLTDLGLDKLQQQASLFGIQSGQRIGTERIQTELENLSNTNSFQKEAEFVRGLQASGQAALGQAGKSTAKSIASAQAESFRTLTQLKSSLKGSRRIAGIQLLNLNVDSAVRETGVSLNINKIDEATRFARVRSGLQTKEVGIDIARIDQAIKFANEEAEFNNRVLKANMDSQIAQIERNIQQIELQKLGQDLQAEAEMSIFPEPLPTIPEPQLGPARTFIKPLKTEPAQVPKGARIDPFNELLSAGAQVASFVAGGGVQNIQNLFGPKGGGGGGGSNFNFGQNNIGDFGGGTPYNFNLLEGQASDAQGFADGGLLSFLK
jgi:hypothetical protein